MSDATQTIGGLFRCDALRARLSLKQCSLNWMQANDHSTKIQLTKRGQMRVMRTECVGCEMGRAHAKSGELSADAVEATVTAVVSAAPSKPTKEKRVELPVVSAVQRPSAIPERPIPSPDRAALAGKTKSPPKPEPELEEDDEVDEALVESAAEVDDGEDIGADTEPAAEAPTRSVWAEPGEMDYASRRAVVEHPRRTIEGDVADRLSPAEVERLEIACRTASETYKRLMKSGARPMAAARYAPDVREMALKLYRHYGQLLAVSQRTGISASSLSWWVRKVDYERRRSEKFEVWSAQEQELLAERGEVAVIPAGAVVTAAGVSVVEEELPVSMPPFQRIGAAPPQDPLERAKAWFAERDRVVYDLRERRKQLVDEIAEIDAAMQKLGSAV